MNFNKSLYRKALVILGILTPLMFVLRLITYFSELDMKSGFFHSNGTLCIVYNAVGFSLFFLSLILSVSKKGSPIIFAFDAEKTREAVETTAESIDFLLEEPEEDAMEELLEEKEAEEKGDSPRYFHHGFIREAVTWSGTLSAFATFLPGFSFLAYALLSCANKSLSGDTMGILLTVLSVLSGAYFIFAAIRNSAALDRKQALFALLPALWCTARLVTEYLDLTRFQNKSLYVGQFLFLISGMIFFVYQAELLLGEKSMTHPNAYAFTLLPVLYFGLSARLPQLVAGMADRVFLDLVDASGLLIDLALTLYALIKAIAVARSSLDS